MFKRARWMAAGAVVGFGGSVWVQRKVKAAVERYLPEQVADRMGERARSVGTDVREALAVGRNAMRQREAELRAQLDPARPPRHLHVVDASSADMPSGKPRTGRYP